ncbi:hypothetical protein I3A86_26625, partial [Salmonella enterica]|nr:hypothetical protein [Salmonella enterica]
MFELLTATYAADEFDLRADWDLRRQAWSGHEYRILREVSNTDFLQGVALLATREARQAFLKANNDGERAPRIGCRRADILAMPLDAYQRWADALTLGFRRAAKVLHQHYMLETKYLPYGAQLIPLASALALLDAKEIETAGAQRKISRWLWCGIFGELY